MEGSSESAWHRSDSFPGLNTSTVSNRNPRPPSHDSGNRKEIDRVALAPQNLRNRIGLSGACENEVTAEPFVQSIEWGDASLRQWLDKVERPVDEFECLHIFRQVVEIVNVAHSQGIVVHNVRPSCFVMSSFNHVSFIESASCSDSGSDSLEDGLNSQTQEMRNPLASSPLDMCHRRCHLGNEDSQVVSTPANALLEASCMQSSSICATHVRIGEEIGENKILDMNMEQEERKHTFPMKQILLMENSWYRSPEEVAGSQSSCASDIYQLGVLLFELFCPFSSIEDKSRTMSSLRHRVLPPQLLLKWPKEASFCMWLLHPEPIGRPSMGELLQSEFLNEPRDNLGEREAAIQLGEKIEEEELLLEFLLRIRQRKRESADKLQDTVSLLCSDIEEVLKRHPVPKKKGGIDPEKGKEDHLANNFPSLNIVDEGDSSGMGSRKRFCLGLQMENIEGCDDNLDDDQESDMVPDARQSRLFKSFHLMKNFKKLESAYFLTRCRPVRSPRKSHIEHSQVTSEGRSSIVATERSSINSITPKKQNIENEQSGWISPFLEGLCKYLSFSKIKVKADLKQGDLLNSSNLVCSLSFDRDAEFFATAGVNKKIKVFECDTIINEERDIHYPVVEMACRSKLSSICWNSYIKSQIASSNFEGVVQVWDVTQSRVLTEMREHERRVWSIDFSSVDPTMLASGSDDGSVKLWSINQGLSIGTIKTKANVCCVQFPSDSSRSLTFGSADHKIYHYDLRNLKVPLCTLTGHNKTVSYVKSVDSVNLVSASTDNTLKLWDLSVCTSLQSFTGHTNVKNFVGLSVSDGYIATGSETNEVFIYHKAFPMPALSFRFGNTDPLSGHETDDTAQFISSVCWRGQSSTLVAANSTGNIKILEMV